MSGRAICQDTFQRRCWDEATPPDAQRGQYALADPPANRCRWYAKAAGHVANRQGPRGRLMSVARAGGAGAHALFNGGSRIRGQRQ